VKNEIATPRNAMGVSGARNDDIDDFFNILQWWATQIACASQP